MAGNFPKDRAIQVVLGLTVFWLVVLCAFFWDTGFNIRFIPFWASSIFLGIFFAATTTQEKIENRLKSINYDSAKGLPISDRDAFSTVRNGMKVTIGDVPINFQAPPFKDVFDLKDIYSHLPKEVSEKTFWRLFASYLIENGGLNQAYATLIDKIIRTYLHDDIITMPAGIDKHTGRGLFTHNLLVCALMLHRAGKTAYRTTGVKPIDPDYKLNPADPIIITVGVAHDIGKIACLVFDQNKTAIGMKENHAQEGCRIITSMPEFWSAGISMEDRKIIQNILAFYHSPNSLPVAKTEEMRPTVTSDRQQAILNLLIECDTLASSIESGKEYSFDQNQVESTEAAPVEVVEINIQDEFLAFILHGSLSINAGRGLKSDAFKFKGLLDGQHCNVLIVDEKMFLEKFASFLKDEKLNSKNGRRSELTARVLEMIDGQNMLLRAPNELGERKAADCLYKVTFVSPDEAREPILTIPSAFLIELDNYTEAKFLSELESCQFIPTIDNSIFGNQGQRSFKSIAKLEDKKLLSDAPTTPPKTVADIKKRVRQVKFSPENFVFSIKRALASGTLKPVTVANNTNNDVILLGANDFFIKMGITPDNAQDYSGSFEEIGLKEFKWSKSNPELFLVILDSKTYS